MVLGEQEGFPVGGNMGSRVGAFEGWPLGVSVGDILGFSDGPLEGDPLG